MKKQEQIPLNPLNLKRLGNNTSFTFWMGTTNPLNNIFRWTLKFMVVFLLPKYYFNECMRHLNPTHPQFQNWSKLLVNFYHEYYNYCRLCLGSTFSWLKWHYNQNKETSILLFFSFLPYLLRSYSIYRMRYFLQEVSCSSNRRGSNIYAWWHTQHLAW